MNAEQELLDLVDERVRAVRERDGATLAARPAEDVITFDVLPPLNSRGSQATAEHLQAWFEATTARSTTPRKTCGSAPRATWASARFSTTSAERSRLATR
jgi:ketosteroid isomerase-like protein